MCSYVCMTSEVKESVLIEHFWFLFPLDLHFQMKKNYLFLLLFQARSQKEHKSWHHFLYLHFYCSMYGILKSS